ncbi:hypothetical protein PoB_007508200 [Plakobranchus ocellatus]|uniref:Uncharacterized protein n=1 Tax=Plakobranchus ocellatus TaxID=259542 RepID=A0AAV4DX24_9GAST|nr:hypothetical protein PoB_007508200 [Plakobranchus ocellatus]
MNHIPQPYAESVYAIHQRYEDTSLVIFNQLQKSGGKTGKPLPSPLGGALSPASHEPRPAARPLVSEKGGAAETKREAATKGAAAQSVEPVTESKSPPQSKVCTLV